MAANTKEQVLDTPFAPVEAQSQTQVDKAYSYWRFRLMLTLIIGYSAFYVVRQNFSMAVPSMLHELGYTKNQIGWVFTTFSLVYGISKFISGTISDRSNARYFMTIGLLGAAAVNLVMGFSESIFLIGVMYAANGFFQSMGWPPCTRLLTHWYGPSQLGTRWGIVNASHQIGSVVILLGAFWLITNYSWRHVFIVPGFGCVALALFVFMRLRDVPTSLGLPSIEEKEGLVTEAQAAEASAEERLTYRQIFFEKILPNKPLWCVCIANFFVYIVRMGVFNWGPTFLQEYKGIDLFQAGKQLSLFEIAGLVGGFLAGWLSDHWFRGRRGRVSFLYMVVLAFAVAGFWFVPASMPFVGVFCLFMMGFLVYGPQVLVGVAAAEFGSKKAACAAAGLTGTFGYLGGAASGIGVAYVATNWGWGATLCSFVVAAVLGALCFLCIWNKTEQAIPEKK